MNPFFQAAAATLLSLFVVTASPALADDIRTERVHFRHGTSGATIEGRIKGYETVDYLLGASAGQLMNVSMATRHTATYFNILAPGENEVAMFNGSVSDNQFEGVLGSSGDYKVRVYMMRSAARRDEVADYRLEIAIAGTSSGTGGGSTDAKVPGTDFHATGDIPCARYAGQPSTTCKFGVVREAGGRAMVTVFWPDGGNRVITFEHGVPAYYDESQADGGARMTFTKSADLFLITIGDQRFEIVDAVIFGG